MRHLLVVAFSVALVSGAVLADGPETGVVTGKVTDAQGQGLPGVTVSLTGGRGIQATITDPSGVYRFALLVPGSYALKAELEGFQPAEGVAAVTAGGKSEIELRLLLGTAEEITVTSEAPMVDRFNVTAGSTVSAEVGEQTAGTTRSYYGIINALPGVTADSENDDIQQTRPNVNGTHFADQAVYIDGVDTTFAKFGGGRVYLPTTSVTEVSMEAGGSSAEYGRVMGSSTNVIVKSGTNKYHVDAMLQHQEVDWGPDYKEQPALTNREVEPFPADWFRRNDLEWEGNSTGFELSIGGPIKRDRAWFFAGLSQTDDTYQEKLLGGDPIDTSFDMESRIFKLNFQPAAAHSLSASYIGTPAQRIYFNPESFDYWTPTPHDLSGDLVTVNWNYSLNSNFFLETKIAAQTNSEDKELACGSTDTNVCLALKQQDRGPTGDGPLRFPPNPEAGPFWPGNNYNVYEDANFLGAWHNGWILSDGFGVNEFPRDQANATLTQFAGANHEIKYGIDYQNTKWEGDSHRTAFMSGYNYTSFNPYGFEGAGEYGGFLIGLPTGPAPDGTLLGDDTCGVARAVTPGLWDQFGRGRICVFVNYNADFLQPLRTSGDAEMQAISFYARDRFTVGDHWIFNLGFRAEGQEGYNDVRRKVVDADYIDPRINVTYDAKANGKLLFSVNAGRYHGMLNQAWIAGGGGTAGGMHDGWNGYEGYDVHFFCDALDVLSGLCSEMGYNFPYVQLVPGLMWNAVDSGIFEHSIDPYFKEEIILGVEWQFGRNWALDTKYIDWSVEDMMMSNTQLDHLGRSFFLTANYKNLTSILRNLELARRENGIFNPDGSPVLTDEVLNAFQEPVNEYQAVQVQVNRRFANGFAVYNNITWSETDTTGAGAWWNNTNSSYGEYLQTTLTENHIAQCQDNQENRTLPVDCVAALTPFLGQSVSTINRRGPNPEYDREIIFNSFGFKTWSLGSQTVTLGGHLTFQTGTPWFRSEGVSTVTLDGGPGTNTGITLRLEEPGANGKRTSDEYTLNLSGAWGFPMGRERLRGELRIDALNVTNQQRQREIDGRGEVYPVRRYFQRPRQLRASFTLRF